jgi:FAS-associated factor 2
VQLAEKRQREREEEMMKEKAEAALRLRQSKREQLGLEPAEGPETTQIVFRLPDGSKLTRRFLKSSAVSSLFLFLDSQESELPAYELVTSFPSHSFSEQDRSLEMEGLCPRALLHVRPSSVSD